MDKLSHLSGLPQSILAEIEAEVDAEWEDSLASYPEAALLWLALTPFWTVKLAQACNFPTGDPDVSVRDLFARLYDEGFCEFTPARPLPVIDPATDEARRFTDKGDDKFRLVDNLRSEIIQRAISKEADVLEKT